MGTSTITRETDECPECHARHDNGELCKWGCPNRHIAPDNAF